MARGKSGGKFADVTRADAMQTRKSGRKKAAKERDAKEGLGKKKKKAKRGTETYTTYIHKVLKKVHPKLSISKKAIAIMNSMISDAFENIAGEASRVARYSTKATIGSREIESAVKLVLRGELAKTAIKECTLAITKFNNCK